MVVTKKTFGKAKDGKEVFLYSVKNSKGNEIVTTNIGACLVSVFVKNDKGEVQDVVLGYDTVEGYEVNGGFFGGIIGPNANRIANGKFKIDGVEYTIVGNNNGNNLHSDYDIGFHKQYWNGEIVDNGVKFTYEMPDMLVGFPGNIKASVTYTLSEDNELKIEYEAVSDKKTVINMTNHSYFNLAGHKSGLKALDTELTFNASKFAEFIDGDGIPSGKLIDVKGTPMDFTTPKTIGKDIESSFEQMKIVKGYDHNYVVDGYDGTLRKIATAKNDGRTMEVYSDLPGFQFYTGNWIGDTAGKDGAKYGDRHAFCIETQYFPNSVNDPNFISPVIDAGKKYHTVTIYKFL